jgi:Cupin-like domain
MQRHRHLTFFVCRSQLPRLHQLRSASTFTSLREVPRLSSWDLEQFRDKAFVPAIPYRLPLQPQKLPSAISRWFVHDSSHEFDPAKGSPSASELRTSFWSEHEMTMVPLELISKHAETLSEAVRSTFHRSEAPLKLLLTYLGKPLSPASSSFQQDHSIYLAQCSLSSLPEALQADLPTPSLVLKSGKGDVYESSLWLGRPPTYTPLHRDPNPNLFLQLAGRKVIRIFPPEVGDAIFEQVQAELRESSAQGQSSASFRGEEMMAGPESDLLHRAVWENSCQEAGSLTHRYGQQAEIGLGQALFIPKGWWHSVKGIGNGITASANWWFR